jgi:hypothetical protein
MRDDSTRSIFLDEFLFAAEVKEEDRTVAEGRPYQGGGFGGSLPLGCTGVTTVSPFSFR